MEPNSSEEKSPPISDGVPPPAVDTGPMAPIDHQLQRLIAQDHPTIMKLSLPIPPEKEYPYEQFLKNNFSPEVRPFLKPYRFQADHFDKKTGVLMDVAKPHTFLALFRFLEFFRGSLEFIERVLPKLEDKFRFFKLLAKQKMDQDQIDRNKIHQNIHNTFMTSYNMLSHSAHVQNLFKNAVRIINGEINETGGFNLRKFYSIRSMENELHPDYQVLVSKIPELLRILTHIDRLSRALDRKRLFRQ